jgi:hypothetical protein
LKRVAENDASRSIASLAGQLLKEYQVKKEIKPESARKGTIRVGNISSVGEINIAGGNIVAGNVEKRLAGDSTIDTPPPEDKKKKGN